MSNIVYTQGQAEIVIPAGESIAVFSRDTASVFDKATFSNHPPATSLLGTTTNVETVFGPYAAGKTVVVEAGNDVALYEVGAAPRVKEVKDTQPDPVAVNVTGAVSATAIMGGIVTSTTAAAVAGTVPTGTVMDTASEWDTNEFVDWAVINTGGNAFTVTAATGHTIVGVAAVATVTTGLFRTRKTAANTFVTYRIG